MARVRQTLETRHHPATFPETATFAPEVEDVFNSRNYDDMNKADLKAECVRRLISTTGTKAVLIQRLEEYDDDAKV